MPRSTSPHRSLMMPATTSASAMLRKLVSKLDGNTQAQQEFVERSAPCSTQTARKRASRCEEDASDVFFRAPADSVFESAAKAPDPVRCRPHRGQHRPGGCRGPRRRYRRRSRFPGAATAVANLLNLTTYFEMKQRAGTVGKNGVAPLIDKFADQVERIHLVGHSFGGRLVTAAAANSTTNKLHSLALLQAAFSHNGFSQKQKRLFPERREEQARHRPDPDHAHQERHRGRHGLSGRVAHQPRQRLRLWRRR